MGEHNFSSTVVGEIAKSAMLVCSNPYCLRLTGYSTTEGKPRAIAEAAHVLPSGKNGPRSGSIAEYEGLDLSSAKNGIWLCLVCHQKIDDDGRKGEKDVDSGVVPFAVPETHHRAGAFQKPEERDSSCQDKCAVR